MHIINFAPLMRKTFHRAPNFKHVFVCIVFVKSLILIAVLSIINTTLKHTINGLEEIIVTEICLIKGAKQCSTVLLWSKLLGIK